MDENEEQPQESRFEKNKQSSNSIFGSLVLIFMAIISLYLNEKTAINFNKELDELQADATLIQGKIKPRHRVIDPIFHIESDDLILKRTVLIYQWKEYTHKSNSSHQILLYNYKKGWSQFYDSSSSFNEPQGHYNPPPKYETKIFVTDANIDKYYIDKTIIKQIDNFKEFHNKKEVNSLYIGKDSNQPSVGDLKIIYSFVPATTYTILGKLQDKNIIPFQTTDGNSFIFLQKGNIDKKTILQEKINIDNSFTWIFRAIGLLLFIFGVTGLVTRLQKEKK